MFKSKIKNILGFVLSFCLVACASATPTEMPPPPTETATPTQIPPTSTPTHTPVPLINLLPTPSPINDEGPWLVHEQRKSNQVFFTNLDGTGFLRVYLPSESLETDVHAPEENVYKHKLVAIEAGPSWALVRLPEGEIVRELLTVSPELMPELKELGYPEDVEQRLVWHTALWSPDGRYFAYVAATSTPTIDIHVYDAVLDEIRVLTDSPLHESIIAWTPNSDRIVYAQREEFKVDVLRALERNIASVSLHGYSIETTDFVDRSAAIFHWINNDEFLIYDWAFWAGLSHDIRKINLLTGESTMVYPGPFFEFAYNPNKDEYLFTMKPDEHWGWDHEFPDGIYRLNPSSLELEIVTPGRFENLDYYDEFRAYEAQSLENYDLIYLNENGDVICNREGTIWNGYRPLNSLVPDMISYKIHLFNPKCETVLETGFKGDFLWLRDVFGFQIHGDVIVRFLEENDWEPEIINENPVFDGFDNVIYP